MSTAQIQLFIIGAGGHGGELFSYVSAMPEVALIGFIDDHEPDGVNVIGGLDAMRNTVRDQPSSTFHYITATGNIRIRRSIVDQVNDLRLANLAPWTLRHPDAIIGTSVEIGAGTCLSPNTVITTKVCIGEHSIINVNASISHGCTVGAFTDISPGATICGSVKIGQSCFIGAGATIIQNITIGDNAIVGAGATVIRDVPSNVTVVGTPAIVIKEHAV